jgi:hypothetical protein
MCVSRRLFNTTALTAVRVYYTLQVSPAPAVATFTDVPTSHPFFQFVEALVGAGITAECAPAALRAVKRVLIGVGRGYPMGVSHDAANVGRRIATLRQDLGFSQVAFVR